MSVVVWCVMFLVLGSNVLMLKLSSFVCGLLLVIVIMMFCGFRL